MENKEPKTEITRVMQDPVSIEISRGQSGKYGYVVKCRGDDDTSVVADTLNACAYIEKLIGYEDGKIKEYHDNLEELYKAEKE